MKKNIIITGASGLVANNLINLLQETPNEYRIFAITTNPSLLQQRYKDVVGIKCMTLEDFTQFGDAHISAIVHCAFSRSNDPRLLAQSLQYTAQLLLWTKRLRPEVYINISSQSIYGKDSIPLWTEHAPASPNYLYAMAKYATEEMTRASLSDTNIKYTNIRLASINESGRFLSIFIKNALIRKPITIMGGKQRVSLLDIRDAASAIKRVIDKALTMENLRSVYNVGIGTNRSIHELAEDVKRIVEQHTEMTVRLEVTPADISLDVGMDIRCFCEDFRWHPTYNYNDMIESMVVCECQRMNRNLNGSMSAFIKVAEK